MVVILALYLWIATSFAENNFTSGSATGAYDNDILMCNVSFSRANATGIFSFDPAQSQGIVAGQGNGNAPNVSWAVTVSSETDKSSPLYGTYLDILYSTGGANYSDDIHLGYDVCAITISPDALYDNTVLRGQSDNGSCLQTFDDNCVNAIIDKANTYTSWIDTASPRPNSNLSSTSLPTVCNDILKLLNSNFPPACQPFINATDGWIDSYSPLTQVSPSSNLSALSGTCSVNGTGAGGFKNLGAYQWPDLDTDIYDNLTTIIYPIMTIFMPTANAEVTSSNLDITSFVTCAHIDHYNSGSRVTPAQPSPTPIDYGGKKGLSGGAIAGIVVGSVIGVLLIALAALFLLNCCGLRDRVRRKKSSAVKTQSPEPPSESSTIETQQVSKNAVQHTNLEVGGNEVNELSPQSYRSMELPSPASELPSSPARPAELPAIDGKVELDGEYRAVELQGDEPGHDKLDNIRYSELKA